MQLAELNNYFRVLTSEPTNTGRWSDSDVATLINQSRYSISAELDWPEGNITTVTVAGQMEYTLPSITKILRVKLAGQILVPTSIPLLEGDQLEFYDQTGTLNTPQWLSQPNTVYPVQNTSYGSPYPTTLPFFVGNRPAWYQRSGQIGLVPQPAGVYTLSIDIISRPAPLVNLTDVDNCYDQFWKEAIVQGAVMRAFQADRDSEARMGASVDYRQQMKQLKAWVEDMQGNAPRGPIPVVYRTFYQNGNTTDNN